VGQKIKFVQFFMQNQHAFETTHSVEAEFILKNSEFRILELKK